MPSISSNGIHGFLPPSVFVASGIILAALWGFGRVLSWALLGKARLEGQCQAGNAAR